MYHVSVVLDSTIIEMLELNLSNMQTFNRTVLKIILSVDCLLIYIYTKFCMLNF